MFSESKYRRDIQVLRGLAVLAVVLFHAKESYFPLGYLGVDVFFVISGFVVTPLIMRIFTDQSNGGGVLSNLRYFYKRRFYRLAPALAVTLAVSAVTIFLLAPISDHQRFARQGIATLLLVGNVGAYKYSGDYFSPNQNPLIHTWSLSIEEQIYIFLPLILMVILHNRRSLKSVTSIVLGFISVISLISFLIPTIFQSLYSRFGIDFASQFSFYSPIDRIWQFTLGGLAILSLDRYQNLIEKISKRANFVLVILVAFILFSPIYMSLKLSSFLATLLALFILVFKSLEVLPDFLIHKLEWIGDRSYSIYLVHMPLLYLAKYSPITQIGNGERRVIQSSIAVVASILLGAMSYSKIENKYRNRGKSNITDFKTVFIAMTVTLVLPLVLFLSIEQGFKEQYWGLDKNIIAPPSAWNLDPNCHRLSERPKPCLYNVASSKRTVLLIGDSHAAHISQAVVDAARLENWNSAVWTHTGCHVQFSRRVKDEVSDTCLNQNQEILKWVKSNKPNAIIVSQFIYSDSAQDDLRYALAKLHSLVPNTLLIENNPIFPDEKKFMVSRPIIVFPAYKPPKNFQLSMMQTKDKNASDTLANWARSNGVLTMNFDSLFCKKEVCTRYSDKGWLYADDDHLSVFGAELTIPQLRAFLNQF